jgi:hypothetical protein
VEIPFLSPARNNLLGPLPISLLGPGSHAAPGRNFGPCRIVHGVGTEFRTVPPLSEQADPVALLLLCQPTGRNFGNITEKQTEIVIQIQALFTTLAKFYLSILKEEQ